MTERSGSFVEKLFYTIVAYIPRNILLKTFFGQCAHIPWNLIVSIGREYMADPVNLEKNLNEDPMFNFTYFLSLRASLAVKNVPN